MTITPNQRIAISKTWNAVCKDRGWKAGDRDLRLRTLGEILGRELTTMDAIGRLDECTKVLHELNAMLGVSVQSGKEAVDQGINRQRNARWLIENEILPCLAIYPLDQPRGRAGAEGYLLTVLTDKSRWLKVDRPTREPRLDDFDDRTTQQILWTLSARLNAQRKAAGHTGHAMKTAAGAKCDCARICGKRDLGLAAVPAAVEEAVEAGVEVPF